MGWKFKRGRGKSGWEGLGSACWFVYEIMISSSCMISCFFLSPSSLFCHRFSSAEPLFGNPAACQKELFSVRSESRSKETGLSAAQNVSPSCIVTLQRKKKGKREPVVLVPGGFVISLLVLLYQIKIYQCHL